MHQIEPQFSQSYKLTLRILPSLKEYLLLTKPSLTKQAPLKIDRITWHTLILRALKRQHGLIGQSLQFELIEIETASTDEKLYDEDNVSIFVVIHKDDAMIFEGSILSMGSVDLQDLCGFQVLEKSVTDTFEGTANGTVDYIKVPKATVSKSSKKSSLEKK